MQNWSHTVSVSFDDSHLFLLQTEKCKLNFLSKGEFKRPVDTKIEKRRLYFYWGVNAKSKIKKKIHGI